MARNPETKIEVQGTWLFVTSNLYLTVPEVGDIPGTVYVKSPSEIHVQYDLDVPYYEVVEAVRRWVIELYNLQDLQPNIKFK